MKPTGRLAINPPRKPSCFCDRQTTSYGSSIAKRRGRGKLGRIKRTRSCLVSGRTRIATAISGESLAELKIIETDSQDCILRIDFRDGQVSFLLGKGFSPNIDLLFAKQAACRCGWGQWTLVGD